MQESKEQIELRHEEIQELLGTPPNWLTRWGITVFFGIIVVLLVGSYLFKYPEIISSPIVVTTEKPASWIVAKSSGLLDSIYVHNKDYVKQGQAIGLINNAANIEDIERLKKSLDSLNVFLNTFNQSDLPNLSPNLKLGELQDAYSILLKSILEYRIFIKNNIHNLKIAALQKELMQQKNYLSNVTEQVLIHKSSYDLIEQQFQRDSILNSKNMISGTDFEKSKQVLMAAKISLNQSKLSVNNTNVGVARLEQSLLEYSIDYNSQMSNFRLNLDAAYE